MNDLLFDVPWWLPTLVAIVGISLAVSGNRRQNDSVRNRGLIIIGAAVVWAAISILVDTDKEKCQKWTKQFVQSVVARDWPTFDGLLDPNVSFRFAKSPWSIVGRDTLDNAAQGRHEPHWPGVGVRIGNDRARGRGDDYGGICRLEQAEFNNGPAA